MNDKRFATDTLGCNPGRISQPVVRMDNIEVVFAPDVFGYNGIVAYLFEKVFALFAAKWYLTLSISLNKAGLR